MTKSKTKAKFFTATSVAQMKPDPDKRLEIHDLGCRGLYLYIQKSGTKSWVLLLTRPNGEIGKLHLGPVDLSGKEAPQDQALRIGTPLTLAAARALAAELYRQRDAGKDVITDHKAEKQRKRTAAADRSANTFVAIAREFFVNYRTKKWNSRPRRWRDDAAALGLRYPPSSDPAIVEPEIIKGSLAETWGDKPITDIDKYSIDAAVDDARKHGSVGKARALYSVLSVLFNWLPLKYRVEINPMIGTKSKPGAPDGRERKLDEAEIKIFWQACNHIGGGVYGPLYKVLLLTGCRLREVSDMTRSELGDNGLWEVPSDRTKNHLPFLVALPPLALDIINAVPPPPSIKSGHNAGLVFSLTGKTPVSGFSKMKKALDAEMVRIAGKPVKAWRAHDLRRTFSTFLNESPEDGGLGIMPHVVEAALNHVSGSRGSVAGVYNKAAYLSEKRAALARWSSHIVGLVEGRKADVTPLDVARGRKKRK